MSGIVIGTDPPSGGGKTPHSGRADGERSGPIGCGVLRLPSALRPAVWLARLE
jgi:hypothetical protein